MALLLSNFLCVTSAASLSLFALETWNSCYWIANVTWNGSLSCFGECENSLHVRVVQSRVVGRATIKVVANLLKTKNLKSALRVEKEKSTGYWVCRMRRMMSTKHLLGRGKKCDPNTALTRRGWVAAFLYIISNIFRWFVVGPQASLFRCNHLLCL